jgi:hypothetical protein
VLIADFGYGMREWERWLMLGLHMDKDGNRRLRRVTGWIGPCGSINILREDEGTPWSKRTSFHGLRKGGILSFSDIHCRFAKPNYTYATTRSCPACFLCSWGCYELCPFSQLRIPVRLGRNGIRIELGKTLQPSTLRKPLIDLLDLFHAF